MIYIAGIFLIYLCKYLCGRLQVVAERGADFSRKVLILLSFAILFLISAFRGYDVGIDTQNYANKFDTIQAYSWGHVLTSFYTERVEFGYAIINRFLGMFFDNPRIIIIVSSAIINFGMAHFVYRYTESDVVAVIIFMSSGLFLHSMNISRQIMACVMMMNAWGALTQKKYWQSGIWFFIGFSFHVTSLVFAVTYYFYYFRKNKKIILITLAVSLLLATLFKPLLKLATFIVSTFSYLYNTDNRVSAGGIWAVWAVEFFIVVFFILSYLKSKKLRFRPVRGKKPIECEDMICIPIFVIYYILFTILGTQFNYLDRFGVYFMPFIIPLFLNYGKVIKARMPGFYKVYLVGLQVCFIGYFILSIRADQYRYSFGW